MKRRKRTRALTGATAAVLLTGLAIAAAVTTRCSGPTFPRDEFRLAAAAIALLALWCAIGFAQRAVTREARGNQGMWLIVATLLLVGWSVLSGLACLKATA